MTLRNAKVGPAKSRSGFASSSSDLSDLDDDNDDDNLPEANLFVGRPRAHCGSASGFTSTNAPHQDATATSEASLLPSSRACDDNCKKTGRVAKSVGKSAAKIVKGPTPSETSPRKRQARAGDPDVDRYERVFGARSDRIAARATQVCYDERSDTSSASGDGETYSGDEYTATPKKKKRAIVKRDVAQTTNARKSVQVRQSEAKASDKQMLTFAPRKEDAARFDAEAYRLSQEHNAAVIDNMEKQLSMSASSQSGSTINAPVPRQAKDLDVCPFCYDKMPRIMSDKLILMMQHWLDQYHLKRHISAVSTLEVCQRHRNERVTIPEGHRRGWPKKLNEETLPRRIRNARNPFMKVMTQRVEEPTSSDWFNRLLEARKRWGRQADSTDHQMMNLSELHAGYYGERGWEILQASLEEIFIKEAEPEHNLRELEKRPDRPLQNLSARNFIERVLLPELICLLIINDQYPKVGKMSLEDAKKLRDDSTEYGIAMFPSKAMGSVKSVARSSTASVFQADESSDESSPRKKVERKKDKKSGAVERRRFLVPQSSGTSRSSGRGEAASGDRRAREPQPSSSLSLASATKVRPKPRPSASLPIVKHNSSEDEVVAISPFASQESQVSIADGSLPISTSLDEHYRLHGNLSDASLSAQNGSEGGLHRAKETRKDSRSAMESDRQKTHALQWDTQRWRNSGFSQPE